MASRQQQGVGSFGFPTFGAPQDLMPIPQITAARALSVPTPTLSGADEESALSIILASILGSASPGIAEGLVGLLLKDRAKTARTAPSQDIQDVLEEYSDLAAKDQGGGLSQAQQNLLRGAQEHAARSGQTPERLQQLTAQHGDLYGASQQRPEEEHPLVQKILELRERFPALPDPTLLQIASQELYIEGTAPPEELPTKGWGRRALELGVEGALGALALSKAGPKAGTAFATARTGAQTQRGAAQAARITGIEKRRSQAQDRLQQVIPGAFKRTAKPAQTASYTVADARPEHIALGDTVARDRPVYNRTTGEWDTVMEVRLPDGTGGLDWYDVADSKSPAGAREGRWVRRQAGTDVGRATDRQKPLIEFLAANKERDQNLVSVARLVKDAVDIIETKPETKTLIAGTMAKIGSLMQAEYLSVTGRAQFIFSDKESGGGMVPDGAAVDPTIAGTGRNAKNIHETLAVGKGFNTADEINEMRRHLNQLGGRGKEVAKNFFSFDEFNDTAVEKAKLGAIQLQLAYMAAALNGQTGRTLSDRDLEFHLNIVGYDPTMGPLPSLGVLTQFLHNQLQSADDAWTYNLYATRHDDSKEPTKKVYRPGIQFEMLLEGLGGVGSEDPKKPYTWEQYKKAQRHGLPIFFLPYYGKGELPSPSNPQIDGYRFVPVTERLLHVFGETGDMADFFEKILHTVHMDNNVPGRTDDIEFMDALQKRMEARMRKRTP